MSASRLEQWIPNRDRLIFHRNIREGRCCLGIPKAASAQSTAAVQRVGRSKSGRGLPQSMTLSRTCQRPEHPHEWSKPVGWCNSSGRVPRGARHCRSQRDRLHPPQGDGFGRTMGFVSAMGMHSKSWHRKNDGVLECARQSAASTPLWSCPKTQTHSLPSGSQSVQLQAMRNLGILNQNISAP
jgi:hypothetical protein